jgi:hypothetical protein
LRGLSLPRRESKVHPNKTESENGKSLIAHSKKLESSSDSRRWPFYVPKQNLPIGYAFGNVKML